MLDIGVGASLQGASVAGVEAMLGNDEEISDQQIGDDFVSLINTGKEMRLLLLSRGLGRVGEVAFTLQDIGEVMLELEELVAELNEELQERGVD